MSVTSRILVVDMLQNHIPIDMITGIMVMHAEKISPLVLEAFIVRLYREKNKKGFLKAFTDQPEHITSGLSPLKSIMKELQLRTVHIYPRFHEGIKQSLERRRADVVELSQHLTEGMADIHQAIIQCMTTTLSELKRSNTSLDLDDFNVDNAYFRQFDVIVRKQLDSVWHRVGLATKQLVNDLGTLRRLLYYLLTYDPLQFHAYLETIISSNTTTASGTARQHQSPWLFTDAANVIFQTAKRRCYTISSPTDLEVDAAELDAEDEDAWEALYEMEGITVSREPRTTKKNPKWVPKGMDAVLEELPKWTLLADIIKEIEGERMREESTNQKLPGSNTVLVMTSSTQTCSLLNEFLSTMDANAPAGSRGRAMMLRKLKLYLWWKSRLAERKQDGKAPIGLPIKPTVGGDEIIEISEALKKKDREKVERAGSRRRQRGGAPSAEIGRATPAPVASSSKDKNSLSGELEMMEEATAFTQFLESTAQSSIGSLLVMDDDQQVLDFDLQSQQIENQFDENFGLLTPEETVLIRAYSDDSDDRVLSEINPRFIVMFEPNMEFIRRIEVYRSASPGMGVRVYHMIYGNSCEEHKYLASIRREKESFERLIREKANMVLTLSDDGTAAGDSIARLISTRQAGGRKQLSTQASQVIVDMREFRSTLPSLLHAAKHLVIPATLTVGDYILSPDICVERKSLSDLVQSFTSGRLYTQCELMSVHYKHPVLLIEFEEDKAFSLDIVSDLKKYAKQSSKFPPKKKSGAGPDDNTPSTSLQSKLVLLTLTFSRLRLIWSSSPYSSAEIFTDLKSNRFEPDVHKAIAVGAEEDPEAGTGVNTAAEEVLRCLPGITAKNVKYVMSRIHTVRDFCEMNLEGVQEILGVEPGKKCYEFMHRGEKG